MKQTDGERKQNVKHATKNAFRVDTLVLVVLISSVLACAAYSPVGTVLGSLTLGHFQL